MEEQLQIAYEAGCLATFAGILKVINEGADIDTIKRNAEQFREQLIVKLGKSKLGQAYMGAIFEVLDNLPKEESHEC